MKNLFFLTFLLSSLTFGQSNLNFDKRFVQSEDKWVAFPADSTNSYPFGFIYIDSEAGLTLHYEGSFQIDANGKYLVKKLEMDGQVKIRLVPNNVKVAHLPTEKLSELGVSEIPDWLNFYKNDENSVERQYRWGYMYNGYGECEKALEFLNKAYLQNPKYEGLRTELAFSHNCLNNHEKAIEYLMESLKEDVVSAYTIKELIFSHVSLGKVNEAEEIYNLFDTKIPDKTYKNENAFNILGGYYLMKDKENFHRWLKETKIDTIERFMPHIKQMIINLE